MIWARADSAAVKETAAASAKVVACFPNIDFIIIVFLISDCLLLCSILIMHDVPPNTTVFVYHL
jgi:hypothetical protein